MRGYNPTATEFQNWRFIMAAKSNPELSHEAKLIVASNMVVASMVRDLVMRQPPAQGMAVQSNEKAIQAALVTAYQNLDKLTEQL
jgi:hypothetical protein